jgi:hypothetical protein
MKKNVVFAGLMSILALELSAGIEIKPSPEKIKNMAYAPMVVDGVASVIEKQMQRASLVAQANNSSDEDSDDNSPVESIDEDEYADEGYATPMGAAEAQSDDSEPASPAASDEPASDEPASDETQMAAPVESMQEVKPCCDTPRPVKYAGCGKVLSDNYVEFRAAYLYPLEEDLRDVFGGNGQYGIELNAQLYDMLYGWVEVDYFTSSGHTIGSKEDTRWTMVPISFGPKFIYNRHMFQPYVGAGLVATYVHTNLINSLSSWSCGGLFKFGCIAKPTDYLVIDLFMDYAVRHVEMENQRNKRVITPQVDISSLSFGGGLGYRF